MMAHKDSFVRQTRGWSCLGSEGESVFENLSPPVGFLRGTFNSSVPVGNEAEHRLLRLQYRLRTLASRMCPSVELQSQAKKCDGLCAGRRT